MREVAECRIPSLPPEFTETRGKQRLVHQRPRLYTRSPPRATQEVERTEVENQNQSDHSNPASEDLAVVRYRPCNDPDQRDSTENVHACRQPFLRGRRFHPHRSQLQESLGIQSRPRQEVSDMKPTRSFDGASFIPRQPLAADKDTECQCPHSGPPRPHRGREEKES